MIVRLWRCKACSTVRRARHCNCQGAQVMGYAIVELELDPKGLERVFNGSLRDSIHTHGEITAARIGSASKRLVGQLETYLSGA